MAVKDAIRNGGHSFGYGVSVAYGSVPLALLVYFCIDHLDRTVSMLVLRYLYSNEPWSRYTSSIPDLLLMTVLLTTAAAYSLYRYRLSLGAVDRTTLTCKLLAFVAPVSFAAKSALKYVFGRTNTREWLLAPQEYGFHWFQGGGNYSGFPSGHMAVFTALTAVMWRLHPRYRGGYLAFLLLMAVAMIVTNYHFVSDVIAGAYLGLLIELCIWRIMREP
jgi:membrane-associated phospholipid phosphatase